MQIDGGDAREQFAFRRDLPGLSGKLTDASSLRAHGLRLGAMKSRREWMNWRAQVGLRHWRYCARLLAAPEGVVLPNLKRAGRSECCPDPKRIALTTSDLAGFFDQHFGLTDRGIVDQATIQRHSAFAGGFGLGHGGEDALGLCDLGVRGGHDFVG